MRGNKTRKQIPIRIGLRTIKSAIAVVIALWVVDQYGASGSKLIFALIGALSAMEPTFTKSVRSCLTQICGVIFGAVFMLTDPVTSPTSAQGRVIFAMGAGILTMLIRLKANLPEGCLYSILLMNMLTPLIESAMDGKQLAVRARARKAIAGLAAIGLAVTVLAASTVTPVNEISSATSESTSEASSEATGGDAS